MSGLNRRGPMGEGPMTGRKMGRCAPANKGKTYNEIIQESQSDFFPGRGFGPGRGRGPGRRPGRGWGLGMFFRGRD